MSDSIRTESFTRSISRTRARGNRRALIPLAGGIGLAGWGIKRRGWLGVTATIGGAFLAADSVARMRPHQFDIHVSQTINKPVAEVYGFARDPRNWAAILEKTGNGDAHGTDSAERRWNWNAEVWRETQNEVIAWRAPGANPRWHGAMQFRPAPGDRGTEVTLRVEGRRSGNIVSRGISVFRGRYPEQRAREVLRGLKQWMETGEIPTIAGQPHGARGARGKVMQRLFREPREQAAA